MDNMQWTLSSDKYRQLTRGWLHEGDTVSIEKWKDGIKKGYNFKSPMKENPYTQPDTSYDKKIVEVFGIPSKAEPYKEVNLAGRGASWNKAFDWVLKTYDKDKLTHDGIEEFLLEVSAIAEKITTHQENFVNDK
jgi:hypothetical protein